MNATTTLGVTTETTNVTGGATHLMTTTRPSDALPGYDNVIKMLQLTVRPVLVVFGTIMNLLSFLVMRRKAMKKVSTCFYMAVLALADTGTLWCGAFVAWIAFLTDWKNDPWLWVDCKLGPFLFYVVRYYSSAILVIMSVEKFIALYFPLKVRTICTVKTAKWSCGITLVLFCIYCIQFLIKWDTKYFDNGDKYCNWANVPDNYTDIFSAVDSVLYSFLPFCLMIMFNFAIIYKFIMAKFRSTNDGTGSTSQALSKSAMKGTAMLITVSVMFIVLTGPTAVSFVIPGNAGQIEWLVMNIMQYLNHSINGVLYCIVGSRFRTELVNLVCCKKRGDPGYKYGTTVSSVSHSVRMVETKGTGLDETGSLPN